MKRVFAYIFLFFFASVSFKQATLFGTYLLNQKAITEKFCVNKDKPLMQCNGKCHLKDALVESAKTEDKDAVLVEQSFLIPVYFEELTLHKNFPSLLSFKLHPQGDMLISQYAYKMKHPPPEFLFS